MSLVNFYIFRHGETDWNLQKKFQGHSDIPLNSNGIAQAHVLKKKIQHLSPQIILSSDLLRARQTADIVNEIWNVPISLHADLRECHLGEAEGVFRDDVIAKFGKNNFENWYSSKVEHLDFGFPKGETKRQHQERLVRHLTNFSGNNPQYKEVFVSTHGGSVMRLVHSCSNAPTENIPIPNCVVYKLQYSVSKQLWSFCGDSL